MKTPAYRPLHYSHAQMRGYFVVGPADNVDAQSYPWGWEQLEFDDATWTPAQQLANGGALGGRDSHSRWMLVPRDIPMMESKSQQFEALRQVSGVSVPDAFLKGKAPLEIPAGSSVRLLLDQQVLTTAYPELLVSGGTGATVRIGYAESLYEPGGERGKKGDRSAVEGKTFIGYYDEFHPDGAEQRIFRPLWWRTFRYVDVQIETGEEPLVVESFSSEFTAYPFDMNARFDGGDSLFDRLMDVGWRTARLCAHETYMDCPYYEQLQYAGDTRLQILVGYYNSGDTRLGRKAIQQLNLSRNASGLTLSRAPSRLPQYIPGFSLWWIGMLHDYLYFARDGAFVSDSMQGVKNVLAYYESLSNEDGTLKQVPWWNYVDWTSWKSGSPPRGEDERSAVFDLQLLLAYQWADELAEVSGDVEFAGHCKTKAELLTQSIRKHYWVESEGLLADTSEHDAYSQHANSLAVLAGIVEGEVARQVMEKVLNQASLTQCSYYFKHYVFEALMTCGMGDLYLEQLGPWQKMLDLNLSTWAERPDWAANPPRSDCHAWSSSPNYHLLRIVLGVKPAIAGFREVLIEPNLGNLKQVSGKIPHPDGMIEVSYKLDEAGVLKAKISLPAGVGGTFRWKGNTFPLTGGENVLELS